ncbi:MAG TPA: histidine kinase [Candidatus Blautia faecavium]|uniref:histidine kinase n=1 Tax=Candidatus Blautia faecavium TaxID=2838487 RepID=A0A9D2RW60_9FIRM|nr:histidine kinase [Candidatus Blautia faecavium]
MERKKKKLRWKDQPLATKVLCQVAMVAVILFSTNLLMYFQVNRTMHTLDTVYASNVNITELADSLDNVQTSMYNYLTVKTSNTLEDYYRSEDDYKKLFEKLNDQVTENPVKLLERNIRRMSETYLEETAETVGAKRGRNVEKYKTSYEECLKMYRYLNSYIADLNGQQFKNNSASYQTLQQSIWFLEAVSSIMLILTMGVCILVLYYMVKNVSAPLRALAATAKLVGQANFNVKMPPTDAQDEVGVLTRAFNTMVASLEEYVKLTKENMEKEQKMVERELLMETHLKEAQLRYLQSQINPHFLFNSLNAGAQLAMMEDAEKTSIFVERMAEFFRYNVKKGSDDATLAEEVDAVENYIYILNVRFSGEIHYTTDVDETVLDCKVPSMILQPIVENAVNHGIRNIEREGTIHLQIKKETAFIRISVKDNGTGIVKERIAQILNGEIQREETAGDSTGVGMYNVISRLELYYKQKDLLTIESEGKDMGTEVVIRIPQQAEEE